MRYLIKKLLLIPALFIGIIIFSNGVLADQTSCEIKSFFNNGVGMTCKWNDWGHSECSQSGISPDPYVCASIIQDNICTKYGCTWNTDHCGGAGITAFAENNFYQYCNMESVPQCYTEQNEAGCLQAGCIFTQGGPGEPSTCTVPEGSGLPAFQTGDVDTIIGGLTTATQGILDFFVSGAALWFTFAAALLAIYYTRRVLALRKAGKVVNQSKAMQKMIKRQKGLRELRRRGY